MCSVYRVFGRDWEHLFDYSDEMLVEMFNHESLGLPISEKNGFAHGKKWLSVNVAMWKEGIEERTLFKFELYEDPKFPHWWLDSIFKT